MLTFAYGCTCGFRKLSTLLAPLHHSSNTCGLQLPHRHACHSACHCMAAVSFTSASLIIVLRQGVLSCNTLPHGECRVLIGPYVVSMGSCEAEMHSYTSRKQQCVQGILRSRDGRSKFCAKDKPIVQCAMTNNGRFIW